MLRIFQKYSDNKLNKKYTQDIYFETLFLKNLQKKERENLNLVDFLKYNCIANERMPKYTYKTIYVLKM